MPRPQPARRPSHDPRVYVEPDSLTVEMLAQSRFPAAERAQLQLIR